VKRNGTIGAVSYSLKLGKILLSKVELAELLMAAKRLFGIFFLTHRRHAAKLCSAAE